METLGYEKAVFVEAAEARGYDPDRIEMMHYWDHEYAARILLRREDPRGDREAEVVITRSDVMRALRAGEGDALFAIYAERLGGAMAALAHAPRPRFRIATRGPRRLAFDPRSL